MTQRQHITPVFEDISFNPNLVEEFIPMHPLGAVMFDLFCEAGWTYWSDTLFRRNYWEWRGQTRRVIPLRIKLKGFEFSKSQRKNLRHNADLQILKRPIQITPVHELLFERHSERFSHEKPQSIFGFFSQYSHLMPSQGIQFDFINGNLLLATSFFHVGIKSIAGNYCIHDPVVASRGLGTFSMLKEIEFSIEHNREYYYPGFVYDAPSEFDYKLNFNNLEYFDWWGNWYPLPRFPVREWRKAYEVGPPLEY